MSHQPPSLLDTCQLFVLLVKVFSALLFQSEESPWKVSVNRVCKSTDIQTHTFSKPLCKNCMSQNAKVIMRNTRYIPYALRQIKLLHVLRIPILQQAQCM